MKDEEIIAKIGTGSLFRLVSKGRMTYKFSKVRSQ
jgi:hypothetical protein